MSGRITALAALISVLMMSHAWAMSYEDYPIVRLRSLDKITARTMTFEAKVGSTVRFGDIFIKVNACRKPPPVEKTESAAFLQVWQVDKREQKSRWVFSGWMFASSPALSAMDHPIYDVWVLDCLGKDPEPLPPPEAETAEQPAPATDGPAPDAVPPETPPEQQPAPETDAALDSEPVPNTDTRAVDETIAPVETPVQETPIEQAPADPAPEATTPTPPQTPDVVPPASENDYQGIY